MNGGGGGGEGINVNIVGRGGAAHAIQQANGIGGVTLGGPIPQTALHARIRHRTPTPATVTVTVTAFAA